MTGYLDWYVIVNGAYNMLIIWLISQDNFISTFQYCGSDICLVVVEFEFAIFFYSFCIQIKIYHMFTAVSGLMFYHEKSLAVKIHSHLFCKFLILVVLWRCMFQNLMQYMIY